MKGRKYTVILVSYYSIYLQDSIRLLRKFFPKNMQLVIVNNGDHIIQSGVHYVVNGSNRGGEFSAWDEGYLFAKEKFELDGHKLVFCNDTFCKHRIFTLVDRLRYRHVMNKIDSENYAVGEVNSFKGKYQVYDELMSSWISSYFFILDASSVELILPFDKSSNLSNHNLNLQSINQKKICVKIFSKNLNANIESWLYPEKQGSGWYSADEKNTNEKIKFKLKAIVNEQLLTHSIVSNNIPIYNVYNSFIFHNYNVGRNIAYKLLKKWKGK